MSLIAFQDIKTGIVLPAKSDSDVKFCLQSYQGLIIDRSLVEDRINTRYLLIPVS